MILYYAMGGGLGHLTRARAFLHTLALEGRAAILTASPFAKDRRVAGNSEIISAPQEMASDLPLYREWLRETFDRLRPDEIYLDTFPAGILGEFRDFRFPDGSAVCHVARILRWTEYSKVICGSFPTFRLTYYAEPLAEEHERFLREHSIQIAQIDLSDPPSSVGYDAKALIEGIAREGRPLWMIVHSGPDEEIEEIIAYAEEMSLVEKSDPQIVLIAPRRPEAISARIAYLDVYPASILFSVADRIITACGFNAMRETQAFQQKHRYIPFARRYDDQFLRASLRRKGCEGQRSKV